VKRSERDADHSPPSSAEVKNAWSYTSAAPRGTTLPLPYVTKMGNSSFVAHPASYPMGSFPGGKAAGA